jgi:hypothetical protein
VNFVNSVIPFSKYNLPEISPYKTDDESAGIKNLHIFQGVDASGSLKEEVDKIMGYYKYEVTINNYKPNDFLVITPLTNYNPLVNALDVAIQMYWVKKYKSDIYKRYSVFHKSEEGTSIDLNESKNATRIVSIHTSKGDGRNVVFVIGVTERALLKFSKEPNNLIYDSLLHVSLTRMKKKIYIRVSNDDDIAMKLLKYTHDNNVPTDIEPKLHEIRSSLRYKQIIEEHKSGECFKLLHNDIISKTSYTELFENSANRRIIDMGHHNIRFASMFIFILIKIYNGDKKNQQVYARFEEIKYAEVKKSDKWSIFFRDLGENFPTDSENQGIQKKNICILKISNRGRDYIRYFKIIDDFIQNIKLKIVRNGFDGLCPLESVFMYYILETVNNGEFANIGISDLYNIIDVYSGSFQHNCNGHDNCMCKQFFDESHPVTDLNEACSQMNKYLLNHYEKIHHLGEIFDEFLTEHPNMKWLIDHNIIFKGENDDFYLSKKFNLIAYDAENVFLVYIKPQFGNLNYNEVLMESIYDTFLLKNCTSPDTNIQENTKKSRDFVKFHNKRIQTVVFSLDNDTYHKFEWRNIYTNEDLICKNTLIEQMRESLIHKYGSHSKCLFHFYKYFKDRIGAKSPQNLIKTLTNHIMNKYKAIPHFVLKFFYCLESELRAQRNRSHEVFQQYDDQSYFTSKLHTIIAEAVDDFLGIETHSDSDSRICL